MIRLTIDVQPGRKSEEKLLEELVGKKRVLDHIWGITVWMLDLDPKLKVELKAEIVEESNVDGSS